MSFPDLPAVDRPASDAELYQARRFVLDFEGPGILQAAQCLRLSAGYVSQLLQGKRNRRLTVHELQRLYQLPVKQSAPLTVSSPTPSRATARP